MKNMKANKNETFSDKSLFLFLFFFFFKPWTRLTIDKVRLLRLSL